MDPRIKQLESGKFYAYVKGCPNPVIGTLRDVEDALGLPRSLEAVAAKALPADKLFTVRITFQHSTAGDGGDLKYEDIEAGCEIEAYSNARLKAIRDGHRVKLNGFSSFVATPQT
jgi:hypothetical protein